MLKAILLLAGLLTASALAQPGSTTPAGGRASGLRKLVSQLDLSPKQKADIQKVMESGIKGEERRQAIYKLLTPDQATKLKALIAEQRRQQGLRAE